MEGKSRKIGLTVKIYSNKKEICLVFMFKSLQRKIESLLMTLTPRLIHILAQFQLYFCLNSKLKLCFQSLTAQEDCCFLYIIYRKCDLTPNV